MASKQSQIDKDIDAALSNIVMGIGHGFKMIFYGIKKLNSIKNVVFLLVMLAISVLAYVYRNPEISGDAGRISKNSIYCNTMPSIDLSSNYR